MIMIAEESRDVVVHVCLGVARCRAPIVYDIVRVLRITATRPGGN
jgi:hypothetical protein